jgi:hypothetical protein
MATYPYELAQYAVYQSHTGRLDWALVPAKPAQRLNTTTTNNNPSARTMALGLTQNLTEMSTRNISWGANAAGA